MFEFKLTKSIWREADRRVEKLPVFKGSHRKVAANLVGCLGEIVVEKWLDAEGIPIIPELAETTHDYKLTSGLGTFDVKTKDRTVKPRPDYDCSVPLYNHAHQQPDYYVFISLQRDRNDKRTSAELYHTAYILGGIDQEGLSAKGKVWKRGQVDPANGTKFWTDCINLHISDLISYDSLADEWLDALQIRKTK